MTPELQQKLYDDFPTIFQNRHLPMTETCMCWGINCGDGWYNLIYEMCEKISKVEGCIVVADQVKEKFGGLNFYYTTYGDDESAWDVIDAIIKEAEDKSEVTCENCGAPGNTSSYLGWIYTLCDSCYNVKSMASSSNGQDRGLSSP